MHPQNIIAKLPYGKPFLFVDELSHVDQDGAKGCFTFSPTLDFYKGHFKDHPITPGVILTETMAQIGLVCLGIYLLSKEEQASNLQIFMTSAEVDFLKPVYAGEKVTVVSTKKYFRFHKLSCLVSMSNAKGELVCKGTISGMINPKPDGR